MRAIPKIVFQHFRNPQNKGALTDGAARGEVDGRGPDSKLRLYFKVQDGVISEVGFDTVKDRSSDAPLSLTTTYILNRPLSEVESLSIETIGAEYGFQDVNLPMLVPAYEALQAALANYRGEANPFAFEGGLICTCLGVREGRIRRAITERQCRSVEDVAFWTRACTGCRSCRPDVKRLLDEV